MSPLSWRRVALASCVFGLVALLAFSAAVTGGTPVLSAEEFDPETDVEALTSASNVYNADHGSAPQAETLEAFERATAEGSYEGTVPNASSTYFDFEEYDYVVLEGAIYEYDADVEGESVALEAKERDSAAVADELAVSLEDASDPVREVIETGEPVERSGGPVETPIVTDDGTYYVVTPGHGSNRGMSLSLFLLIPAAVVLAGVGAVLVGGGLWVRKRRSS